MILEGKSIVVMIETLLRSEGASKGKGAEMKKKLLSAVLVAGIAIAPMAQAQEGGSGLLGGKMGLLKDLAGLFDAAKDVLNFALKGVGLKETAQGFSDLNDAIKTAIAELDKPIDKVDFTVLIAVLAETNEIALAMNEDFKKTMNYLMKPLKKILPAKEVKLGDKTVMLDEIPAILTDKAIDLLGLYYKLVAKLLNFAVKTKESIKQKPVEKMKPGEIIMDEAEEIEMIMPEKEAPMRRTIEM